MSRVTQSTFDEQDVARAIVFEDLAKNYRVFAFPKSLRSRTEARRMANWLTEQLSRLPNGDQLPLREPEIYGTPLQWDVFLFASKCDEESLLNAYRLAKPKVKPIDRSKKWRKEYLNYIQHFRALSHQIEKIFPVNSVGPICNLPGF